MLLHELVRADSSTDHHCAVALDLDAIGHIFRGEVSMAGSQQDGGLGLVEPQPGVLLEGSAGDGEHPAQVQRVPGVALEVVGRGLEDN